MNSINPIAYLPCELKGRDFDSRLLLASHLLHQGIAVVIGQQWAIWDAVRELPKGCLVATSGSQVQGHNARVFQNMGHKVVLSDEEALALVSPPHILANVTQEALDACDLFLAQSPNHARIVLEAHPASSGKIRTTGNPRCDLLTTEGRRAFERVDHPRPFILFNSNFALTHYLFGDIHKMTPEECKNRGLRMDMVEWENRNKIEFNQLITWCLDNLPDYDVVIRPHPAETETHGAI